MAGRFDGRVARAYADALAGGASVIPVPGQRTVAVASHRMRGRQDPNRRERDDDNASQYMPAPFHLLGNKINRFAQKVKRLASIIYIPLFPAFPATSCVANKACLACGECARVCPAHAVICEPTGFRLLLGGRMGRHPVWATELSGLYTQESIPRLFQNLLRVLFRETRLGERPGQVLARLGIKQIEHELGDCFHD